MLENRPVTLEEAKKSLVEFDADKSGALGFPELVALLAASPWRETLPPQARSAMPAVARSFLKNQKQQRESLAEQRCRKLDDSFTFSAELMTTMLKWKTNREMRRRIHGAIAELTAVPAHRVHLRGAREGSLHLDFDLRPLAGQAVGALRCHFITLFKPPMLTLC